MGRIKPPPYSPRANDLATLVRMFEVAAQLTGRTPSSIGKEIAQRPSLYRDLKKNRCPKKTLRDHAMLGLGRIIRHALHPNETE